MKSFVTVFVLLMLVGTAFGSTLVIKGSNTVYPVAQLWAKPTKKSTRMQRYRLRCGVFNRYKSSVQRADRHSKLQ